MKDLNYKIILYIILIPLIILFIIFAFVTKETNLMNLEQKARLVFIIIYLLVLFIIISVPLIEYGKDFFLIDREAKVQWTRKYVWELKEELELLWEADELQKKITSFKNKMKK